VNEDVGDLTSYSRSCCATSIPIATRSASGTASRARSTCRAS